MSYQITVKALSGAHLGKHVTVKTKHTEASGVLQGFEHATDIINDSGFGGESWALGQTRTTITLLPDQRIVAEMGDEVIVHGDEPEIAGKRRYAARGIVKERDPGTAPWRTGDNATYCGVIDGKHIYLTPENAVRWGIKGQPVKVVADEPRICDNRNAAHQAEMNGGPV